MRSSFVPWLVGVCAVSLVTFVLIFYVKGKTVKEYYDDGALKTVYFYKKGKIDGEYSEYYPNGNIKLKARFSNGVQVDTLIAYYDDGTLKEVSCFQNGKKSGAFKDFYSNGRLKSIGWANDGYKDSLFTYYSRNEEIDSIILYSQGKIEIKAIFEEEQVNYQDFRYSYYLNFPRSWEFDISQQAAVLLLKSNEGKKVGDLTESLNITFYHHEPSMSIENFVSSYLISMEHDIPTFKVSSKNYLGDRCEIRYMASYEDRQLEAFVTIIYGSNDAYMITCTADESKFKMVEDVFKKMSSSFRKMTEPQRQNLTFA